MGDEFELKEYQRKTELVCAEESLHNSYKNVEAGKQASNRRTVTLAFGAATISADILQGVR